VDLLVECYLNLLDLQVDYLKRQLLHLIHHLCQLVVHKVLLDIVHLHHLQMLYCEKIEVDLLVLHKRKQVQEFHQHLL
jgi:hypothetical protein